jgi:DNA repair protein RadA/Sms
MYRCQECGYESAKWFGKCPGCGNWNSLLEEPEVNEVDYGIETEIPPLRKLEEIKAEEEKRFSSGISEFDSPLGGGIVPGSLVLIGGDPGIGKSTLLLQTAVKVAEHGSVLYLSGEESSAQVKLRAERLGVSSNNLYIASYNNISWLGNHIESLNGLRLIIVDSIQAVYQPYLSSAPGTVSQIKECTNFLLKIAKAKSVPIFIVGHVTKEGSIAGPKILEHIVDTVLYFEGEKNHLFRILRACKNRFGSTNEIGVFRMEENGLSEVVSPSEAFLSERPKGAPGSVVAGTCEGNRSILVEIQALTTPTVYGMARREVLGVNYNRVLLLIAVLEKRMGYSLGNYDLFVNVAGGIKVDEPAADLGVCVAIVSSFKERPIDEKTVLIGEVGLSGEIRAVNNIEKRIEESGKLGFSTLLIPHSNAEGIKSEYKIVGLKNIQEALERLSFV